jgi:hypothetical protein
MELRVRVSAGRFTGRSYAHLQQVVLMQAANDRLRALQRSRVEVRWLVGGSCQMHQWEEATLVRLNSVPSAGVKYIACNIIGTVCSVVQQGGLPWHDATGGL